MLLQLSFPFPALLLGVGASLFCLTTPRAVAIDTVELRYNERTASVSIAELRSFVRGGTTPQQLLDFFQATGKRADIVRNILGDQISIGSRAERFLETSTGEFVILQLDRLIAASDRRTQLESLRTALNDTIRDDNRLSILELLEKYPGSTVTVNLSSLEPVYNRISGFIGRVEPALEAVKSFLQDLICECSQESSAVPLPSGVLTAQARTQQAQVCVNQAGEIVPLNPAQPPTAVLTSSEITPVVHAASPQVSRTQP